MGKFLKLFILGCIALLIIVVAVPGILGYIFVSKNKDLVEKMVDLASREQFMDESLKMVDFAEVNPQFNFLAKIPSEFEAEYVTSLRAINVYNPNLPGSNNIEKSQIYITYFNANSFLTLNTVDIIGLEKMTPGGREAILYTITKKTEVPNFLGQPNWRNFTHKALDIRVSENNPSIFYSFAYNPKFSEKGFNDFINSLEFK